MVSGQLVDEAHGLRHRRPSLAPGSAVPLSKTRSHRKVTDTSLFDHCPHKVNILLNQWPSKHKGENPMK